MSLNFNDLHKLLESKNVMNRAYPLKAAATDDCKSIGIFDQSGNYFINITRPIFEEKKGKDVPHWLRRQIAKVNINTPLKPDWIIETVPCGNLMISFYFELYFVFKIINYYISYCERDYKTV